MCALAVAGSLRTLCDLSPIMPKDRQTLEFQKKSTKLVDDRIAKGKNRQDIFTHLLGEDAETGRSLTKAELNANAQLLIVAGAGAINAIPGMQYGWITNLSRYNVNRPRKHLP
jgi:cytochrome P450